MSDGGDKIAKIYTMEMYLRGDFPVPLNLVVAEGLAVALLLWLRSEAAEGINLHALYGLACCYYHGAGVVRDEVEALKWFRLAANQGLAVAQDNVGCFYARGKGGMAKDKVEALNWYHLAADQGHADAQYSVGYCYDNGKGGVAEDKVEALKWYRLAADQGHAIAQYHVGYFYDYGEGGVEEDKGEALEWYQLSFSV
jgi:TPR repeat protein